MLLLVYFILFYFTGSFAIQIGINEIAYNNSVCTLHNTKEENKQSHHCSNEAITVDTTQVIT